ncbi:SDR family oxidoreductase [Occultella aeris]|uniref:Putative oxidoreductase n=1 Tax=Occultella aeris TaxID=2761496 RepID=A0A7M4DEY1_9MICO|nr:SDR family oxidoreductase [Occultella aeris]VZO35474.1 putative oxidoreductase [Occultella aeris]
MTNLDKVRVVVTGAAGGIGSALARRLHAAGARLALTSRDPERLDGLVRELGGPGDGLWAQSADLADEPSVESFFEGAREHLGSLDALVNVAGLSRPGQIVETSLADFEQIWHANVTSAFLASKHAVPLIDPDAGGAVINVSSVAGLRPNATAPLYCTAKAALDMFTRAFALQVKQRRIRVTALNPGGTDTPFWGDRPVDRSKLMSAEDVVDVIMFVLNAPSTVQISAVEFEPFHP